MGGARAWLRRSLILRVDANLPGSRSRGGWKWSHQLAQVLIKGWQGRDVDLGKAEEEAFETAFVVVMREKASTTCRVWDSLCRGYFVST